MKDAMLFQYFTHLSTFSYDRARELLEKERDCCKGSGSKWQQFLSVLLQLCIAERQYTSLSFLQTRGFLRKEGTLRSVYDSMLTDLDQWEVSEVNSSVEDHVALATCDLIILIKGRLITMEVYEKLTTLDTFPSFSSYIDVIKKVKRKDLSCGFMEPWTNVYFLEVGLLLDGLMMCSSLSSWQFYKSLTDLQAITEKLDKWNEIIQTRETRKMSFATSLLRGVSGGQVEPVLYTWFSKFRAALLSKFSLYFYTVLSKQCSGNDMRGWMGKLPSDISNKIAVFCRRSDAANVCLIFNGNNQPGFKGPGYHIQVGKSETTTVTGLDLFPCIFYHPVDPSHHWPNIVMIISNKEEELDQDRNICFYDGGMSGAGFTYFIHLVEPRFYIVIFFEGRRTEKDSAIQQFIQETCQTLRLSKIFQSLKSS